MVYFSVSPVAAAESGGNKQPAGLPPQPAPAPRTSRSPAPAQQAPAPAPRASRSPAPHRKNSRGTELPAASDFYLIYQQQKQVSPASSGAGEPRPGSGGARQRSASPHHRQAVQWWEQEARTRGHSQDRTTTSQPNMPEKAVAAAGGGIMDRLASLQKNGEEGWKKRVKKEETETPELLDKISKLNSAQSDWQKKGKAGDGDEVTLRPQQQQARPVSLVDRLSKLNNAQTDWQKKVGEKDTDKFTVAGKMEREKMKKSFMGGDQPADAEKLPSTPTSARPLEKFIERSETKRTPKMQKFKGSETSRISDHPSPVEPEASPTVRTASAAPVLSSRTVAVPQQDQDLLSNFFSVTAAPAPALVLASADLDSLASEPLLGGAEKRGLGRPARRVRGSRNPLRQLAARTDLATSYTELHTGLADKEVRRINVEKASKHSHLAVEALAGLASTEDFTSVQLKKERVIPNQNLLPYREKMLLQVKGRRFCQTRLVPPEPQSLNSGDCFVLVTPTEVFCWLGRFSNVIERARAAEVALVVQQKKELGCKAAARVETVEEEQLPGSGGRENRKFWRCLTGQEEPGAVVEAGPPEEDEVSTLLL